MLLIDDNLVLFSSLTHACGELTKVLGVVRESVFGEQKEKKPAIGGRQRNDRFDLHQEAIHIVQTLAAYDAGDDIPDIGTDPVDDLEFDTITRTLLAHQHEYAVIDLEPTLDSQ